MPIIGNVVCDVFKQAMWTGDVDFATDAFKLALYTSQADLGESTTAYTTSGEVVAGGYVAGGSTLTVTVQPTSANGTTYVSFQNLIFNAALTARGALIYKDDGALYPAVCVLDFGADRTSTATFTVQFPAAAPTTAILRIT